MTLGAFEAEHKAIDSRFHASWDAVAYPVAPSEEPVSTTQPWVRLTVLPGDMRQIELGSAEVLHRAISLIVVQVFIPARSDVNTERQAAQVADAVKAIFHRQEFRTETGGLVRTRATSAPRRVPLPQRSGQAWVQFNVTTPYQLDEVM